MSKRIAQLSLAFAITLLASSVSAQQKPVRILVGLAPGGGVDSMARIFADKLRETFGQPFIVENRAGASGLIAMDALRAAPADGMVLLFAPNGGITLIPQTFRNPRFDPFKDVVPVAMVGTNDVVVVANANVKATSIREFVALAKTDPGVRNFGAASGTILHLGGVMFGEAAGIEIVHVPYKGAGQVIADVLGGVVGASVVTSAEAVHNQRAGKLRILASFSPKRSALLPDVPTLTESGYPVVIGSWYGFYARAETPPEVIDRLGRAMVAAARAPETRERLLQAGVEPVGRMSGEVLEIMRSDYANWSRAIRIAKLPLQD